MNIIPIYDQYNRYDYDVQQDVEDIIEDTLGEDISSSQKEELADSITFLIDMYSKKYFRYLNSQFSGTNNMPFANYYPNSYYPNSMIPIPALNSYQQPPINYFPQNLFPSMPPTTISPNPYQMQMFPQFPLLPYDLPIKRKRSNNKTRSKSKSAKKKSISSKESKDKIEKKDEQTSVKTKKIEQTSVKTKKIDKDADSDTIKTIAFNPSSQSNGIIEYLTASKGGDIIDVISVKINVPINPFNSIQNILRSNSSEFVGLNRNEFSVTFTFKRNKVEIANYTIHRGEVMKSGQEYAQLKNWVFEISDDKNNWSEIDRQTDVSFEQNEKLTFNVRSGSNRFVHYCRLRHNGQTSCHAQEMSIRSIEFYGRVRDDILIEKPTNEFKFTNESRPKFSFGSSSFKIPTNESRPKFSFGSSSFKIPTNESKLKFSFGSKK